MKQEYKNQLIYWKKSLSDSLKTDLNIEKLQHFEIENFKMETEQIFEPNKVNGLIDFEERRINRKRGITDKKHKHWADINEIEIFISPIKIKPLPENLVYLKGEGAKFPFWFSARINRKGKLQAPEETFPLFQRKYLEPLADEKTEFIFGTAENIDKAATIGKEVYENYSDYIKYVKNVFKKAIEQKIESYKYERYETIGNGIILLPNEEINAAISIIQLYEKILQKNSLPQLLKTFITLDNSKSKPALSVSNFININPLHLGQMGNKFPISISQRKSLYTYLQSNDKVFAVNGPPGTGKTTLLQSVVANKFVESAINGNNAPIILACSTNNQAVTNIIDSFLQSNTKEGKFIGRWLPEVSGYAAYLPASGKAEAALKGINYKKLNGDGLFGKIENRLYLNKAKEFFIEQCSNYLEIPVINIKDGINRLQKKNN
jgi:Cdc6-like AAA superfamily ATPase